MPLRRIGDYIVPTKLNTEDSLSTLQRKEAFETKDIMFEKIILGKYTSQRRTYALLEKYCNGNTCGGVRGSFLEGKYALGSISNGFLGSFLGHFLMASYTFRSQS